MDNNTNINIEALDTKTTPQPPTQLTTTNNNQTPKSLSFANGTLKRHSSTVPPPPQPPSMVVSYKECLKNHAASIGGHALDGCGEFMPSSSINPSDPRSLKCAACGCHRNFHRRDPQEHTTTTNTNNINNPTFLSIYNPSSAPPPPLLPHRAMSQSTSPSLSSSPSQSPSPISSPSPPPLSHMPPSYTTTAPHMLLALGTSAYSLAPPSSHHDVHSKNQNFFSSVTLKSSENPSGKKRYRTKFSKEQKEKMYGFSEKLGWRMQKGDDGLVQQFCNDIGVSRGVFKVWMHNNKNTFRKRSEEGNAPQSEKINDDDDGNANVGVGVGGGFDSDINNPCNPNGSNNDVHMSEDSCVHVHVSLNGLSS